MLLDILVLGLGPLRPGYSRLLQGTGRCARGRIKKEGYTNPYTNEAMWAGPAVVNA